MNFRTAFYLPTGFLETNARQIYSIDLFFIIDLCTTDQGALPTHVVLARLCGIVTGDIRQRDTDVVGGGRGYVRRWLNLY